MTKRPLAKDPYNIVITGVGGQGNVMASRVLVEHAGSQRITG